MTTLILLLPQRSRLRAQGRETGPAEGQGRGEPGREYDYVFSRDGQQIDSQGRAPLALLPRADTLIAVPAEADVGWQRLTLPRAGRGKLRAALAGLLEEALLDDPEALHFAVEPEAQSGAPAWVAVMNKAWLADHLAQLEQAQRFVDRVLPLSWPGQPARGHFLAQGESLSLRWSHPEGAATLCLEGSLARDLFAPASVQAARWTAEPAVVAAAERWLGAAVAPLTAAERALSALAGPWNLRQFDLAPRTRGVQAARALLHAFMGPRWRPVRWGLAGLLLVQLLGLNLWAWQQQRELSARRAALTETLTATFPQVRAVLDAPVQMRRETELLRASAGRAGEQDLEALLAAAATAWPADRGPADALSFEPGRLLIPAAGWSDAQIQHFRSQLQSEGWRLDVNDGRLALSRARSL